MADRKDRDISADELLAKLKASMASVEGEGSGDRASEDADGAASAESPGKGKHYKFRRTGRTVAPATEEEIREEMPTTAGGFVSPVPKSAASELDIDALMKKYLTEEEYREMTDRSHSGKAPSEKEAVASERGGDAEKPAASAHGEASERLAVPEREEPVGKASEAVIDETEETEEPEVTDGADEASGEESADTDGTYETDAVYETDETYEAEEAADEETDGGDWNPEETGEFSLSSEGHYAAPDSDLFEDLSRDGKVCDLPEDYTSGGNEGMEATREAPLRPMTEDETRLYQELLAAQGASLDDAAQEDKWEETTAQADVLPSGREEAPEEPAAESVGKEPSSASATQTIPAFVKIPAAEAAGLSGEDSPETEASSETGTFSETVTSSEEVHSSEAEPSPDGETPVEDETSALPEEDIDPAFSFSKPEEDVVGAPTVGAPTVGVPTEDSTEESTEEPTEESASDGGESAPKQEKRTPLIAVMRDNAEEDRSLFETRLLGEEELRIMANQKPAAPEDKDASDPLGTKVFHRPGKKNSSESHGTSLFHLPEEKDSSAGAEGAGEDGEEAKTSEGKTEKVDARLLIALGMEEELEREVGKEEADRLRSDAENLIPDEGGKAKKRRSATSEKEFLSPAEARDIFDAYKTQYGKSSLRLFGMIAVVAILFFYENLTALGGRLGDWLNPEYYPVVNVMVGLQLLFIGFAIHIKSLIRGVRGLLDRKPTPESFLPVIFLVTVLYAVLACFFGPGHRPLTFFFPASLSLLLASVCERLDLRREIMTFRVVSSKRTKFALEKLELDDAELETQAFDEFLPKQPSIFKINKTAFVDGYFRRTRAYPSIKLILGALIPASAVAAAVGLIAGFFLLKGWQNAVMLSYTAFTFALPASVFVAFGFPSYRAAKQAYADKSAFVGEAAMDEYTTAASISFDDREVFPTSGVKLRSVKVFGSGRLDTVIYNVASIYSILGGPLSDVLNVATADLGHSENAEILSVDNEGVEAVVDGRHLYAGKADYLRKHDFVPLSDPEDEELEAGGEISMMYLVCDDEVVAKLYVRYRIDPGFEVTLKRLYHSGICVGIKTVDPNINDAMLSTRIKLSKYPVRVLKYTDVADSKRGSDRTDSGIVSRKSAKALLSTFTLCDKLKHVINTNIVVSIITMAIGLIIPIAVALLGSLAGVSSFYAALFQLFWLLPVWLVSKFML